MVDILRTALSGLLASQRSLATTGHNIANVNTPNFSRQRVDLAARLPQPEANELVGRGVDVAGIARVYDDFLTQQVRNHSASVSELDTLNGLIGQVSGLAGDGGFGLSPALQTFFDAVQDVADAPDSAPARGVMLSQGEVLAARFQDIDGQLSAMREQVNTGLREAVDHINTLADAIAVANRDIIVAQSSTGAAPNDLLDHRDKLLADLSERIAVRTAPQSDGALNVFIGNGQSVVVGYDASHLAVGRSAADPRDVEIRYPGQPAGTDLSGQLNGGQVGGLLAFRRDVLSPAQNSVGLLAVGLAATFNAQHREGIDLDGNPGGDFFQAGVPRVLANANNAGSATLTVTIEDAGQLRGADYQVGYDGASYTIRRLSDQQLVASGGAGPFNVDGLSIDPGGGAPAAGDRFLIQPTRQGAAGFAVTVADPDGIAAALPVRGAADPANRGSATISAGQILDSTDADLRRPVEVRFTAAATYDVVDTASNTTLAAGQAYSSGSPIAFNGWEVRISGSPQTGDRFSVTDNAGGVGDNRNALALAGLQSRRTLLNGSSDYQGTYAQLVSDVGARARRTESTLSSQQVLLEQATQARDAVSGVNLDEEAADLLRFQQAYEASAQLIRVADSLIETLLGVARR